jgi:hypothetical protein
MNIGDFVDHWSFANRPDGLGKTTSDVFGGTLPVGSVSGSAEKILGSHG